MAALLILILVLFLLFYIFSQTIWVRIISEDVFKIEIHMPLLSLLLKSNNSRDKKKCGPRLSPLAYLRIISAVIDKLNKSSVEIKSICIPINEIKQSGSSILRSFVYQYLIFSVIAYFKSKTNKISFEDNAFVLSPDIDEFHFYITIKSRLYEFVYAAWMFKKRFNFEMKKARINKNVRE